MTMPDRDLPTAAFQDPVSGASGQAGPRDYPFLEPPTAPGDLGQLAHYRVLRLLGAGGMGYVFEAEDTHLARRIALKVMRPEFAADLAYRERFLREARAAAALDSDFVVTVYQVGMAGDVPFQAMQFLTGESVQDRLARGPLPVGLACLLLRQAAAGLAAAHEKGLIHRDIKPANIWIEKKDEGGRMKDESKTGAAPDSSFILPPSSFFRAKILDFGLARTDSRDTHLTASGVIVGTPHYMSPEQASGRAVDGRADLFSLGCVAYAMLTGEMAFDGPSTMAVLMALATHTPPRLTEKNPAVPPALAELVASMMAKDPADRPQSAAAVCAALDAITPTLPDAVPPAAGSGLRPVPVPAAPPTPAPADTAVAPRPVSPAAPAARRRPRAVWIALGVAIPAVVAVAAILARRGPDPDPGGPGQTPNPAPPAATGDPIPVGVLHSATGTMATSESQVVDATLLAIDEVNAAGGVLGRKLHPVVVDGKSDPDAFKAGAERLLAQDRVAAIFGCWTSASRKAVRPVVERNNGLLFYPVQYEGLEQSPRVVYLGPAANQQLEPAVAFLVSRGKKRLFLVGSDYVFPRAAHEIVKDLVKAGNGAEVAGEKFLPLGTRDVAAAVAAVKAAKPDAVLNTINGTTNFHFFRELNADPETARIPVLSLSLTENDLRALDPAGVAGDFLAGTYFEAVRGPAAVAFLEKFRGRYGAERRFSDPLAAAYCGVHLWAKAATATGSTDPEAVTKALRGMTFAGPVGEVKIDPDTLHSWLPTRIGRVGADGAVEPVSGSDNPTRPIPFPPTRTRPEWDRFLADLYLGWDGRWQPAEERDRP